MISEFEGLSEAEVKLMNKAPILVVALIGGADGKIDNKELNKAVDLVSLKQSRARPTLVEYYKAIATDFEKNLREFVVNLATGSAEDNVANMTQELEQVNPILAKIDNRFAVSFYASMKDIAKQVAEASGGFLGYGRMGYEETKAARLEMLNDPAK